MAKHHQFVGTFVGTFTSIITAGDISVLGNVAGIARNTIGTASANGQLVLDTTGIAKGLTKDTGSAWVVGQRIWWEHTASKAVATQTTTSRFLGHAYAAATAAATTGDVVLGRDGNSAIS